MFVSVTSSTLLLSPPWASPVRPGRYVLSAQFMANIIWQLLLSTGMDGVPETCRVCSCRK